MPSASLSQIKNFKLTWEDRVWYTKGPRWYVKAAVHFTQHSTTGKAFNVTHSYTKLNETLRAIVRDFGYWKDDFKLQLELIEALRAAAAKFIP